MKQLAKKLLPLTVLPFLVACGNGTTVVIDMHANFIMASRVETNTKISLSVQKANGDMTYRITIGDKTSDTLTGDVKVKGGQVSFLVSTMNDEVLYENAFAEDGNFEVKVSEAGKYKIKLNFSDFNGSYVVTWAK